MGNILERLEKAAGELGLMNMGVELTSLEEVFFALAGEEKDKDNKNHVIGEEDVKSKGKKVLSDKQNSKLQGKISGLNELFEQTGLKKNTYNYRSKGLL